MSKTDPSPDFNDRFRGPEAMVRERLEADYLALLRRLRPQSESGAALDLGCGRGEWLALATACGFAATGVDLDEAALVRARAQGLSVEQADLLQALTARGDGSLALVSAFQVVEHLPWPQLEQLLAQALRVLEPGGVLLLETPNPENLLVSCRRFHLDPTHVRPVPLDLLEFAAQRAGFAATRVWRLHEPPELLEKPEPTLLEVLDGASPDYALVAQKAGSAAQMRAVRQALRGDRGLSLELVADRFERRLLALQAEVQQLRHRLNRVEPQVLQTSTLQNDLQTVQESLDSPNQAVLSLQAGLDASRRELTSVYASRSWRLTAPLRDLTGALRRIEQRNPAGRRLVGLLRRLLGLWRRLRGSRPVAVLASALGAEMAAQAASRAGWAPPRPGPYRPLRQLHASWQELTDFVPEARLFHTPDPQTPRQLLVDVSALVVQDVRTGIQRVSRSVLSGLIDQPPRGFRVEPVYATTDGNGYRYARRWLAAAFDRPAADADGPVQCAAGDVFLGLDLAHAVVLSQRDALVAMRHAGVSVHLVVYDLLPVQMPQHFTLEPGMHEAWLDAVTALDGALCISRSVADELAVWLTARRRPRVSTFRIEWFHLGADIENSVPTRGLSDDAEATLAAIAARPAFLMVGTLEPRKGVGQALAAFEQLWQQGRDLNLVLVGKKGWLVDALIDRLRRHPEAGRRLLWLDQISDEYLERVYASATCLLAASEGEGFGLPLIEAARHHLPILARDIPVFREVAGDHAQYFAGDHAALAVAIDGWLARHAAGTAPVSQGLPWLTWAESRAQLCERLLGYPLRDQWYDEQRPEVSLVVLNFERPAMTLACIESLWQHTAGYRYEIVLVDNGSAPERVAPLRGGRPGYRLLEVGANRFFGEGNNLGAEAARGRFLVFLNNDTLATAGWLEPLIGRLRSDPGVGAVGPRLVSPDGILHEAGAELLPGGGDHRLGRGARADDPQFAIEREVTYLSAAALAMPRATFEDVLGFDLRYEPAYYEDCDLCLKVRQRGQQVLVCPDSVVVHIENATTRDESGGEAHLRALVLLNRQRFLTRWQAVLDGEAGSVPGLLPVPSPRPLHREGLPSVLLYTPYPLLPGGGERYLLTLASELSHDHNVTLASPLAWSRLRLRTLGRELGIDLDRVRPAALSAAVRSEAYDLQLTLGNEALPGIPGHAARNVFICQFPFPADTTILADRQAHAADHDLTLVYSDFVARHLEAARAALACPPGRVEVLAPPAPPVPDSAPDAPRRAMVLGVGRFFTGGHDKRHDLMIEAFRQLAGQHPLAELHLAGTVLADPVQREHFARLQAQAADLPVYFHPNCEPLELASLYREASLYWHCAGLGVDESSEPHRCEHFGITVVEAMSAGCIVLVPDRGGPPATVTDGVSGVVYRSLDELVARSCELLQRRPGDPALLAMRHAAAEAAGAYRPEQFARRARQLLGLPERDATAPTAVRVAPPW